MPQLTPAQQRAQRLADEMGRALVTTIDGRVAIVLPAVPESEYVAHIGAVVRALEAAGIGTR
jgi:hypothetical protein